VKTAHGAERYLRSGRPIFLDRKCLISFQLDSNREEHWPPFHIFVDKKDPVPIFDSHNLSIIFNELDTISDFAAYLDAKLTAISAFDALQYRGEEDLLAHYLMNSHEVDFFQLPGLKENHDQVTRFISPSNV
jgi:hypothetical protein